MFYPNPVRESATLMISVRKKENLIYSIIYQNGTTVQQKNITVNEGNKLPGVWHIYYCIEWREYKAAGEVCKTIDFPYFGCVHLVF
jgi:hypothetical protein